MIAGGCFFLGSFADDVQFGVGVFDEGGECLFQVHDYSSESVGCAWPPVSRPGTWPSLAACSGCRLCSSRWVSWAKLRASWAVSSAAWLRRWARRWCLSRVRLAPAAMPAPTEDVTLV